MRSTPYAERRGGVVAELHHGEVAGLTRAAAAPSTVMATASRDGLLPGGAVEAAGQPAHRRLQVPFGGLAEHVGGQAVEHGRDADADQDRAGCRRRRPGTTAGRSTSAHRQSGDDREDGDRRPRRVASMTMREGRRGARAGADADDVGAGERVAQHRLEGRRRRARSRPRPGRREPPAAGAGCPTVKMAPGTFSPSDHRQHVRRAGRRCAPTINDTANAATMPRVSTVSTTCRRRYGGPGPG